MTKIIGPIRRIDELGRVVIPKEYRKILKIEADDEIEFIIRGGKLELKPYKGDK